MGKERLTSDMLGSLEFNAGKPEKAKYIELLETFVGAAQKYLAVLEAGGHISVRRAPWRSDR